MKYATILCQGLLVAGLAVTGCSQKSDTPKGNDKTTKDGGKKDDHVHGKGPNGGVVFDFGKYHAELDIQHPRKEMIVLILGSDEKTPVAVAAKELTVVTKEVKGKKGEVIKAMTITLKPVDEKDGKATKFVGTNDSLGIEAEHEGSLFGEVDGKQAQGEFKE